MSTNDSLDEVVPFETSDGSTTLYDNARKIHYRSHHGAISESRHVFLQGTGLLQRRDSWRVAELGFGAAVNFTQTVRAFRGAKDVHRLIYHSVDWRPVTPEHLTFHDGEAGEMARKALKAVHDDGESQVCITSEDGAIELHLHAKPWEEVDLSGFSAQAFFHDPFAKRVNPESWTAAAFAHAKAVMDQNARLATYSAATSVKRAMFEAGLWVASAPGPGRKREMTVASPSRRALAGLELLDRDRYLEKA